MNCSYVVSFEGPGNMQKFEPGIAEQMSTKLVVSGGPLFYLIMLSMGFVQTCDMQLGV